MLKIPLSLLNKIMLNLNLNFFLLKEILHIKLLVQDGKITTIEYRILYWRTFSLLIKEIFHIKPLVQDCKISTVEYGTVVLDVNKRLLD
jgi:hypothetical protein